MELDFGMLNVTFLNSMAISFGIFDCYLLSKERLVIITSVSSLASCEKYLRTCHFFAGRSYL